MYNAIPMELAQHRNALANIWVGGLTEQFTNEAALNERIEWLYRLNPGGSAYTWLGATSDEDLIGCGSVLPRETHLGHQVIRCGVLVDLAIHQRHRCAGAALAIQKAVLLGARDRGLAFVYGWPNHGALPILKRVGYTTVGASETWVKPLRSVAGLLRLTGRAHVDRIAATTTDSALWLNDWRLYARHALFYRCEAAARADSQFDELWVRSRVRGIVGTRTSAYLNWRYAEFTGARYSFFCLRERTSGLLVGYIVYKVQDAAASVSDLYCEDLDRHLAPLLLSFAHFVRRHHVKSIRITYAGKAQFTAQLPGLGFFRREAGRKLIVNVADAPPELRNAVLSLENWFMFEGELDL